MEAQKMNKILINCWANLQGLESDLANLAYLIETGNLMEIKKRIQFALDNLNALVEGGRNISSLIQEGHLKEIGDDSVQICDFEDEVVMRFKKRKAMDGVNATHSTE